MCLSFFVYFSQLILFLRKQLEEEKKTNERKKEIFLKSHVFSNRAIVAFTTAPPLLVAPYPNSALLFRGDQVDFVELFDTLLIFRYTEKLKI